jgi:predicted ATPase
MLTAFYALDMRFAQMPGLVVIEEPDTALNPMLLRYYVEQLRNYVEGEHPRQVIMTTHNPRFLDWFKPEEVRIVERDEQGYTSVHQVPDYIKDIWLDKHTLGEVWMTRSLGGVPE